MISTPDIPLKKLLYYLEKQIHSDWLDFKRKIQNGPNFHVFFDDLNFTFEEVTPARFSAGTSFFKDHAFPIIRNEVEIAIRNFSDGCKSRSEDEGQLGVYIKACREDIKKLDKIGREISPLVKEMDEINLLFIEIIKIYGSDSMNSLDEDAKTDDKIVYTGKEVFRFTEKIGHSFFTELYRLAVNNEIIDKDKISKESFRSSFLIDLDIKGRIDFSCITIKAVAFLEFIKPIFEKFTVTLIVESELFYTKQGNLLSQSNYDTTKSKYRKKFNSRFPELKEDIDELLEKNNLL